MTPDQIAAAAAEEIQTLYHDARTDRTFVAEAIIARYLSPALAEKDAEIADLKEKLDAAECACSDEEAAHKDTLRQLATAKQEIVKRCKENLEHGP